MPDKRIPPGQQLVAAGKWPLVGEKASALPPPQWTLEVRQGSRAESLTIDELRDLGEESFTVDIHCVTRWSRLDSRFSGVSLRRIVEWFTPTPQARFVAFVAHSERRHSTSLPLDDSLRLGTFLAVGFEGAILSADHGGPIRTIVPQRYFYKSVKWLSCIEFLEEDRLGYWEAEAGYHNVGDPWQEQRFVAANIDKRRAAELAETKQLDGLDLMGLDLRGQDLANLSAAKAQLRNANFAGAVLAGASFARANLSGANLRNADLRNANFRDADIEGADLSGADVRGADFRGASLFGVSFVDSGSDLRANLDATTIIDQESIDALCPEQANFVQSMSQRC
jgi:DMSO/TMAO reductase YedYZ molybdopterin-dependent catalytic subunit